MYIEVPCGHVQAHIAGPWKVSGEYVFYCSGRMVDVWPRSLPPRKGFVLATLLKRLGRR